MPDYHAPKLKEQQPKSAQELIPAELIEFISSEKTSSQIADICLKNGVGDENKIENISYKMGWVILGRLPKEDLAMVLKNGVGLDAEISEKISADAERLIFSQIPLAKQPAAAEKQPLSPEEEKEEIGKPLQKSSAKDVYREPFE